LKVRKYNWADLFFIVIADKESLPLCRNGQVSTPLCRALPKTQGVKTLSEFRPHGFSLHVADAFIGADAFNNFWKLRRGEMMRLGEVQHIAISVSNMEEALQFYSGIMGLEVMMDMEMEGDPALEAILGVKDLKMRYVIFNNKGGKLNLLEFKNPKGENVAEKLRPYDQAIHHIAFSVDDVEAAYKELSAKGIEFISPPQNTGLAKATAMRGPDGVIIELFEMPMQQ
jgi:catechol 2,3-dioxygenase-like lactoylglutathione lyase family enzyme